MIDKKSEEFIERTMTKLREDAYFDSFVTKIIAQTFKFYMDQPRNILLARLEKKMRQGALEHGPMKTSAMKILLEIENEDLDKLGWNSMLEEAETI